MHGEKLASPCCVSSHSVSRKLQYAFLYLFGHENRWYTFLPRVVSVISCSIWRTVYVIQLASKDPDSFDPTWYSPTAAGIANIEVHLAVSCAAMPVFWPGLERSWNKIFVTHEVEVTMEYGRFPSRSNNVELQSTSSNKNLTLKPAQMAEGWEPFVGDETGLGENETVVVSPATVVVERPGFA